VVIRRSDRVSTVLSADESLIDVFVGLSPAFERLRNPAMRKVMSRLVTVEQAARMAGVDPDELVARLNAGGASARAPRDAATGPAPDARPPGAGAAATPPALRAIPGDAIVDVDVRDDLRKGKEPFSRIMAARREVTSGGALRVRAIFEPVPLYAVMEKQGLAHYTEQLGPEDWSVWFYPVADEPALAGHTKTIAEDAVEGGEGVVVLDVRGLEPPEPMVRTLAALEELPAGGTLVQLNVRVPKFLLPQLEERGFAYEIREQSPDLVRLFITRNPLRE
jgi:uncharacterized protein (DUF2249 family)